MDRGKINKLQKIKTYHNSEDIYNVEYKSSNADDYINVFEDYENKIKYKTEIELKKYKPPIYIIFQTISYFLIIIFAIILIIRVSKLEKIPAIETFSTVDVSFEISKPDSTIPYNDYYTSLLDNMKYNDLSNIIMLDQNKLNIPYGCETVSAVMLLTRYNISVTPYDFIDKYLQKTSVPTSVNGVLTGEDPTYFYIGDPYSIGYGIFAQGLCDSLNYFAYIENVNIEAVNLTGISEDKLKNTVNGGTPVLVWATVGMSEVNWNKSRWLLGTGNIYQWPSNEHCYVLIAIDDNIATLIDPMAGDIVTYETNLFIEKWNEMGPYKNNGRQVVSINYK